MALDGPLFGGRRRRARDVVPGGADQLLAVLRHAVREVLEAVTVADLANGNVPIAVGELVGAGAQIAPPDGQADARTGRPATPSATPTRSAISS